MNPALDISTTAPSVVPTSKLRCAKPQYDPGGNGINVALVAHVLGPSVAAVFPSCGPSGRVLEDLLAAEHVPSRSVRIGGSVRESSAVTDQRVGDVAAAAALTVPGTGLCRRADVSRLFAEQTDANTTDTHETHSRAK
ncbi:PfkB family carbohydrate kinase [Antrihabitans sp. NCIMB 15449]|uniref:PfkB family carbohydrate kinase n=1 Tax=Antrihabitans spumae TaxID=3373370 RepID=A0ABW7JUQ6_9NOCA